jgi:hypothetical protein
MRTRSVCALLIALLAPGFLSGARAQSQPISVVQPAGIEVVLTGPLAYPKDGRARATLVAVANPYATGGPWASVPGAMIAPDATQLPVQFRIRAWREGGGARVLVFAVRRSANGKDEDEQIATVALQPGGSVEVKATEKYGAAPVIVEANVTR